MIDTVIISCCRQHAVDRASSGQVLPGRRGSLAYRLPYCRVRYRRGGPADALRARRASSGAFIGCLYSYEYCTVLIQYSSYLGSASSGGGSPVCTPYIRRHVMEGGGVRATKARLIETCLQGLGEQKRTKYKINS